MITYENNGVKKQRLKAPTRLPATEVVPNRLYLAQLSFGSWTLVRVQCTKEPGWLRGYVNVHGFYTDGLEQYHAWVTVEPVNGGRHVDMLVTRRKFKEPWTFMNDRQGTLMEPPPGYLHERINELLEKRAEQHQSCIDTTAEILRLVSLQS